MHLKEIKITNLRGIRETRIINPSKLNLYVGKNDVGKSTILKALDYTLGKNSSIPPEDLNVSAKAQGEEIATVELLFDCDVFYDVIIDGTVPTNLLDEELVTENNKVKIKYEINFKSKTPSVKTFIWRKIYEGNKDFFPDTITKLKSKCEANEVEIDEDTESPEDNNPLRRKGLRLKYQQEGIEFEYDYDELPKSGSNRKAKLAIELRNRLLPEFEYFQADTALSESDSVTQRHFKNLTRDYLESNGIAEIQEQLDTFIGQKLNTMAEKMNEVANGEEIKPKLSFDWAKVIETQFISSRDEIEIPLSSRGDGFRRIAMMAYFEYIAEEKRSPTQTIIFGFEEPEAFLHPGLQQEIMKRLVSVSESNYQVFLTTHSPVIVSSVEVEEVEHVTNVDNNWEITETNLKQVSEDLGCRPDHDLIKTLRSNALLLVEGKDDVLFLNLACKAYKNEGKIDQNFSDLGIQVIPIGGKDQWKHWVNMDFIKEAGTPFLLYLDSDIKEAEQVPNQRISLINHGLLATDFLFTRKRCIENYITANFINSLGHSDVSYTDYDDVCSCTGDLPFGQKNLFIETYGRQMSYENFRNSYSPDDLDETDEFLEIYTKILAKIEN